ncbi:MAG: corrinoid protein [Deltaproteobacteria bacterium]|nr:corrinoid protein [Deltaproteobacteria bacterium]MBW2082270.1 corrinoid protein [Deltaproteobacteria bacterium]
MAEEMYEKMAELVIAGKGDELKALVKHALEQGKGAKEIIDMGLLPGMDVVGKMMKTGEMFIPEVLLSARTMQGSLDILKPLLVGDETSSAGAVIIGTVEGDLHDIGKNLVAMLLEGAGFTVINLGTGIKPEAFVEAVKEHKPDIVGMSALLTTTMPKMDETIQAIKEAGLRDQVKVMVGGAPVTEDFAEKIGADGYGANAAAAVEKAKALMA